MEFYSIPEIAKMAGRNQTTMRMAIVRGNLKATKFGRIWIVYKNDYEEWWNKYKDETRGRG
jgi:excisionase family DNA binding protein